MRASVESTHIVLVMAEACGTEELVRDVIALGIREKLLLVVRIEKFLAKFDQIRTTKRNAA